MAMLDDITDQNDKRAQRAKKLEDLRQQLAKSKQLAKEDSKKLRAM